MKNARINKGKKKSKICGLIVWMVCFAMAVHIVFGMEMGGFEIDIGVGSGSVEDVWSNSEEQTGNNIVNENNTVPEIDIVPEVESVPEVEYVPEVESMPEVEYVPEVENVPETEYTPKVENTPKVEYVPETEYIPKTEHDSKTEHVPEIEYETEVKNTSEIESTTKTENDTGETINVTTKENIQEEEEISENGLSPAPEITLMVTPDVESIKEDSSEQLRVLEFYDEEVNMKKQKMKCCRYENYLEKDEMCIFQLPLEDVVHILSFRINGKECEWEIKENMLIGKKDREGTETLVEIMYLCDEEDHMMLTEK